MPGPVSNFPTAISAMLQQNFLNRAFEEYLRPNLRYWHCAEHRVVPNHVGDTLILTRPGLLQANPDPVDPSAATGLDNNMSPAQWNLEQYQLTLQLFDGAQDIDLMTKEQSLVDRFTHSVKTNNVQAAQSIDIYARNCLFGGLVPSGANSYNLKEGYLSGSTFATAAGSSSTTMAVDDVTSFGFTIVNGQVTAVSGSNKLQFYINGTLQTAKISGVTPDNAGNTSKRIFTGPGQGGRGMSGTLTLDSAITWSQFDVITAIDAPAIFRPNAKTSYQKLAATDTLGQAQILDAVAYLRNAQVPTLADGTYLMVCDWVSMRQLFGDQDFKIAGQGLMKSDVFTNAEVSRYLGVTVVHSSNAPVQAAATNGAAVTVRRPIIMGADALVDGYFEGVADFASLGHSQGAAESNGAHMSFVEARDGIAVVLRPPLDRLSRNMSIAWQSVRDFVVPTDVSATTSIVLTGNGARRKRAAVIEHAG